MKKSGIKKAGAVYTVLIFIVLYLPILIMVLYSFTAGSSTATFSADYAGKNPFGYWYQEMFRNEKAMSALTHSLTLAVLSSLCATVIGTAAAIGLRRISRKWVRNTINTVTNIPMMNPDIVTGLSMMLLFAGVFAIIGSGSSGFVTILIAHITFNLPYVILSVTPKLRQMDKNLPEAALDLGCTPIQSFFKVELPYIFPAVLSGAITAFTLSLDDYVISLFTAGTYETLPVFIYSLAKKGVKPSIYALSTFMLVCVLLLLVLSNVMQARAEKRQNAH